MHSFHAGVRDFLSKGIVVGDLPLPMHYADFERLDDFQAGFRTQGHTGESLVSETDGDWHPDWYVIAMTGLDDPVFIHAGEARSGYPVYTAVHGAGRWDALRIAPSLEAFGCLLEALAEANEDIVRFEQLIVAATGPVNDYWREVLDARQEAGVSEQSSSESDEYDPADFARGHLIVNDLGAHKLKVVQIIRKCRGLALKEALAQAPPFEAASGTRRQLRRLSEQLEASGATVEFRPE